MPGPTDPVRMGSSEEFVPVLVLRSVVGSKVARAYPNAYVVKRMDETCAVAPSIAWNLSRRVHSVQILHGDYGFFGERTASGTSYWGVSAKKRA
jgi:hypothetical protein